jgi:hypothetical protein
MWFWIPVDAGYGVVVTRERDRFVAKQAFDDLNGLLQAAD